MAITIINEGALSAVSVHKLPDVVEGQADVVKHAMYDPVKKLADGVNKAIGETQDIFTALNTAVNTLDTAVNTLDTAVKKAQSTADTKLNSSGGNVTGELTVKGTSVALVNDVTIYNNADGVVIESNTALPAALTAGKKYIITVQEISALNDKERTNTQKLEITRCNENNNIITVTTYRSLLTYIVQFNKSKIVELKKITSIGVATVVESTNQLVITKIEEVYS